MVTNKHEWANNSDLNAANVKRPLNKAEQRIYNRLKHSFEQIKLHQEGKIELRDAKDLLKEL